MRVLNLYAGIGGNRLLWENVEVTAIEYNKEIAKAYQERFPQDKVIICDAHQYLLDYYEEFDFIWSSPPCPTHSRLNNSLHAMGHIRYPSMKLYEEIIFLTHRSKAVWVIENVISYYDPLIRPIIIDGHYFWSNKVLNANNKMDREGQILRFTNQQLANINLVDFEWLKTKISGSRIDTVLHNCVLPQTGKSIFDQLFREQQRGIQDYENPM